MTENRRLKLSDVEAGTNYFLPRTPSTFEKTFPDVDSLRVEVETASAVWGLREGKAVYNAKTIPAIINCRNPRCYGGGVKLDDLLRWSVIGPRKTEFADTLSCVGYEGSPKGRRRTGSCDTCFKVSVAVTYKDGA